MALTLPLFLFVIFGSIDLSRWIYYSATLDYALMQSARWGGIGKQIDNPENPGELLSREASIKHVVMETAKKFGIKLTPQEISLRTDATSNSAFDDAGVSGDYFIVSATHSVQLFFGFYTPTIEASAFVRNEPYA